MKKNITHRLAISLLAITLITSIGCKKDYLDLTHPSNQTTTSIFSTTKNAWTAINGMHRALYRRWYSDQKAGGQSGNMIFMDVLGEDMVMTAVSNKHFIPEYRWLGHRSGSSDINKFHYGFYYSLIGNANIIIKHIDGATGPQDDKNFIKGQALAYRAWAYFQMIQLFAPRYEKDGTNNDLGLSLVLEPQTEALPRNSVEEVYMQINKDLDEAIELLAPITKRPSKSQLTIHVAKGIKARVALVQGQWNVAAAMAAQARKDTPLMNNAQYMEGFSNTDNPEWIWGVDHRDDHPTYFYSFYSYLGNFSSTNTRGNPKAIFSKLYNLITKTDVRKKLWDPTGTNTSFPVVAGGIRRPYMTRKFMLANPGNSNGDLVFMRAAEMYLIEAEAMARAGKEQEAKDALYKLAVNRDPAYKKSRNAGSELLKEILVQRRIELWGEGFRFYDLKRQNSSLDRTGGNHSTSLAIKMKEPAGSKSWVFLIPRSEIDYTSGIVKQNPL